MMVDRETGFCWSGRVAAAALAMLALTGCVTAIPSVEVTRFHGGEVARMGRIAVVPADVRNAGSLEFRTQANAVAAALGRVGFAVLDEGSPGGDYRALVGFTRETLGPGAVRRSPVSVGVSGSTGSYGSGLGLGIGIDLSGPSKPVVIQQLRVQIRRTSDDKTIWEGRAETAAKEGSPAAQPGIAAGKLADALFRDFPGQSGATITVK
jgi:hypothetical protein